MISIVTATFNSASFIEDTYQSILNQTYTDWEWIVTDDCSTDNTWQILLGFSKIDSRVKVFRNKINMGAAFSRNHCFNHIKGNYVAFIDSDDVWCDDKLTIQIEYMVDAGRVFSFTAYELIDENGYSLGKTVDSTNQGEFNYYDMLAKRATLGCSTVMLNSSIIASNRMPDIRTGQDYAFWLQILKSGYTASLIPKVLTRYRVHNGSISRNKFRKAMRQWEIYRSIELLNVPQSFYYFLLYAIRAIFRKG